jgi:U3 small nucleolar RNA-associated protein 11
VTRERSQPLHRKKLGLLEKHSDYVKRARDFHSKEKRIQKLKEKASFRNKDEFYHSMVNTKTKQGVHVQSRGNEPLPVDLVKVLKNQDSGYIRTLQQTEQGRVDKLKEKLASLVDNVLPQPIKPNGDEVDDDDDDWDMYSNDEPIASTSSSTGRSHVVFTDDLDKGDLDPFLFLYRDSHPEFPRSIVSPFRRSDNASHKTTNFNFSTYYYYLLFEEER